MASRSQTEEQNNLSGIGKSNISKSFIFKISKSLSDCAGFPKERFRNRSSKRTISKSISKRTISKSFFEKNDFEIDFENNDFEIVLLKNDFEIVFLKNDFKIVLLKNDFEIVFKIVFTNKL